MNRILTMSDPHFGHENVTKFRPHFSSVEEHDQQILKNVLKTVTKHDKLFIQGDVCFTKDIFHIVREIASKVKSLHIILGNHDMERPANPTVEDYASMGVKLHALVKYKEFWLSHAPIHESELRGKFNVHGHTHGILVEDLRYINVCMEHINFTPIDLTDIHEEVKKRKAYIRERIMMDNLSIMQSYAMLAGIELDLDGLTTEQAHDKMYDVLMQHIDENAVVFSPSNIIKKVKSNIRGDWSEYYKRFYHDYMEMRRNEQQQKEG